MNTSNKHRARASVDLRAPIAIDVKHLRTWELERSVIGMYMVTVTVVNERATRSLTLV